MPGFSLKPIFTAEKEVFIFTLFEIKFEIAFEIAFKSSFKKCKAPEEDYHVHPDTWQSGVAREGRA